MVRQHRRSIGKLLLLSGFLLTLFGLGGNWGVVYGQSAGPTPTAAPSAVVVTIAPDDPTPAPGQIVTITVRIGNNGGADATNVNVSTTLPPGLRRVGVAGEGADVSVDGDRVSIHVGLLRPGETVIVRIRAQVVADANGQLRLVAVLGDGGEVAGSVLNVGGNGPLIAPTGVDEGPRWSLVLVGLVCLLVGAFAYRRARVQH